MKFFRLSRYIARPTTTKQKLILRGWGYPAYATPQRASKLPFIRL
ncbi:hypothetical protein [Caminibacter sp.]